ncbi:hypothetical protein STENM223S_07125 [Streptomyces tendae]
MARKLRAAKPQVRRASRYCASESSFQPVCGSAKPERTHSRTSSRLMCAVGTRRWSAQYLATLVLPAPAGPMSSTASVARRSGRGAAAVAGGTLGTPTGPPGGSVSMAGGVRRRAAWRRAGARPGRRGLPGSPAAGRARGRGPGGGGGPGRLRGRVTSRRPSVPRLVGRRQRRTHCVLHPVPLRLVQAMGTDSEGPPARYRTDRPLPSAGERPGAAECPSGSPSDGARRATAHLPVGGEQDGRVGALQHGGLGEAVEDDEAQQVAAGLLVDLHVLHQLGPLVVAVVQRQPHGLEDGAVAVGGGVVQAAGQPAQFGGEVHADGDGGAVAPLVPLVLLDGVAEGVAVVEDLAEAGLLEVAGDHLGLHPDRALDQLGGVRPGRGAGAPRGSDSIRSRITGSA